jgi:hypothetical protein
MSFQIQGQMYHLQGPLLPSNRDNSTPQTPKYAQLYILDPQ